MNGLPFLLIDEVRYNSKIIIENLLYLASEYKGNFSLDLFGYTMQRIYADGIQGLGRNIPPEWGRPVKRMIHRSPQRVVELGKPLRSAVDSQIQLARDDGTVGTGRLFIVAADEPDVTLRARQR